MHLGTREAQFAGSLYPSGERELLHMLERMLTDATPEDREPVRAQAVFLPHGPMVYAAECACTALAQVEVPDTVLILHPETVTAEARHGPHQPADTAVLHLAPYDHWQTPLGDVPTDWEFWRVLNGRLGPLSSDSPEPDPEDGEHAGEVVLPYLQMLNSGLRAVILSVRQAPPDTISAISRALAGAIRDFGDDRILIVAASDFHFGEPRVRVESKDDLVLEAMEKLDMRAMGKAMHDHSILISGATPISIAVETSKLLGCSELIVAATADSAEATGDYEDVAGYASGWIV